MARRKVTFVYDPEETHDGTRPDFHLRAWPGVDPLSVTVEELPDPPIRQRFVIETTVPANGSRLLYEQIQNAVFVQIPGCGVHVVELTGA